MIPLNPFDPRARANPYPLYQYMRTVDPVHKSPLGFWILTRYDDCRRVLEDDRWSHDADRILEPGRGESAAVDPTVRLLRASVAFSDPPAHTETSRRLEGMLKKRMEGFEGRVKKVARNLLKLMREKSSDVDLIRDFANPLPLVVLTDLFGLAAADRAQLQRWGFQLAAGVDPSVGAKGVANADAAAMAMVEYLLDRLDAARDGGEGMIGEMASSPAPVRTWALAADIAVMLITGIETTRGLLGNGMLALLHSPEQLERLRREPSLMARAIEELIRYDGPVHLTARVANEDVRIGDLTVAKGEQALALLGAANHDPSRFAEPDRLDIARTENPHLGFGAGSHACFAAPLARVMCKAALGVLLDGVDSITQRAEPAWHHTVTFRSLSKLPVAIGQ